MKFVDLETGLPLITRVTEGERQEYLRQHGGAQRSHQSGMQPGWSGLLPLQNGPAHLRGLFRDAQPGCDLEDMMNHECHESITEIKLGYGQGCLDLMMGEEAEVVLAEELPAAGPGEIERSIDQCRREEAWMILQAANRPRFWSATSPGLLPATSCFRLSSRG